MAWVLATVPPAMIDLDDQHGVLQFLIWNCRTVVASPTEYALLLQTLICNRPSPASVSPPANNKSRPTKAVLLNAGTIFHN